MTRKNGFRVFVSDGTCSGVIYEETAAQTEAAFYLKHNPEAKVSVQPVETDICAHCGQVIVEKIGWVLHKWIHLRTGTHLCYMAYTQAQPKEEVPDV
jgi:hypothetical protein